MSDTIDVVMNRKPIFGVWLKSNYRSLIDGLSYLKSLEATLTRDISSAPIVIIEHAICLVVQVPNWSIIKPNKRQIKFVAPADMVKIRLKWASCSAHEEPVEQVVFETVWLLQLSPKNPWSWLLVILAIDRTCSIKMTNSFNTKTSEAQPKLAPENNNPSKKV